MGGKSFKSILRVLLGFFVSQNIVWIYKGNSATYLYIETFIALILFFITFKRWKFALKVADINIKRYILISIFIVPVALGIFSGTKYEWSPVKGCVSMLLSFMLYFVILMSINDIKHILKGLYWGFIISFFYSFLCFIFFQVGIEWRVVDYFSFEGGNFASYTTEGYYRAQGFFMECSYYMCYLASVTPLFLYFCKNGTYKLLIIFGLFFLGSLSFSGNMLFFLLSIGLYIIFVDRNIITMKQIKALLPILAIGAFFFIDKVIALLTELNFVDLLSETFNDLDVNDEGNISNVIRMNGIIHTLEQIPSHPLGVGYGCAAPLLDINYSSDLGDQSTYSFPLQVILESGWLGFFFYSTAIFSLSKKLFKGDKLQKTLCISLVMATICQAVNGIGWFSFTLLILALANVKSYGDKIWAEEGR